MTPAERLPAVVRPILALLLERMRAALGERLVALYLYGSLSSGDFDPTASDVDFLAVTQTPIAESDAQFAALRAMHAEVAASGLPFATHLEGSYIPLDALRRYDPADAWHPSIGGDWPFQVGHHDTNWVIERAIVRERGIVLYGPPPETLIDPVSPQQLRDAVCQQMSDVWRRRIDDSYDHWPRPRLYPAFAVLTLCRALYTLQHGAYCSKPAAATWASEQYRTWQPIIAWALTHRADHEDTTSAEFSAALTMLREALTEAQSQCDTPSV